MTDAHPDAPPLAVSVDGTLLLAESFDAERVTALRHAVTAVADAAGLSCPRRDDFVFAVNELVTNAVRHGGGQGQLRLWRDDDQVICEISDTGTGIAAERLRQRNRPAATAIGGWGLWLAEQLTDSMAVHTGPTGTTVRVSARITSRPEAAVDVVD